MIERNPDDYFPWQVKADGRIIGSKPKLPWRVIDPSTGKLGRCWLHLLEKVDRETRVRKRASPMHRLL